MSRDSSADVIIVGAGVMGLMAARELAAAGCNVTLLERGEAAREASWAGGGIVSPLYPWRYLDPITALASWSQGCYVELARELESETGLSPELRQKGLLMLSVDDEAEALSWADRHRRPLTRIGADEIRELEPHIRIERDVGLWMPEVASIRNPRLGRALRRSVELNPSIKLVSHAEVSHFELQQGRVTSVETAQGRFRADQFLVCGGAWSAGLMEALGLSLAVEPVKGQMLLFNNRNHDPKAPLLDRVVLADGRYLIPREDGRILVGSTLERVGFDKQTSSEARESLYESALNMLPALQHCDVEAQWAGLRPGSPDGVPYIGAVEGVENLFLNAGHFRNGLVLAPASCRLVADLMLGRTPEIDPAPYRWSLQP
ncbi:glycine oxidase ThiO [Motiliproteus sp.]|uniref:glycine oxidase ThiO n=1 Tax=Motiliproteus sp. TaxID=1898955 RepID=UPI003BA9E459